MPYNLTPLDVTALEEVSAKLGIPDPNWLRNLIYFETAGTMDAKSGNRLSSARGLVQFINSTAQSLGFADSTALVNQYPTFDTQLRGPVYRYLKTWAPYPTEYSLYMAVFFPAARAYPGDMTFLEIFRRIYPSDYQKRYDAFVKANPGILTPNDYVAWLKKKPLTRSLSIAVLASLAGIGLAWWLS